MKLWKQPDSMLKEEDLGYFEPQKIEDSKSEVIDLKSKNLQKRFNYFSKRAKLTKKQLSP